MLEVWRIFNSPASLSVKVKLYNELLFCWGKKIKGKLLTVFGDDKRELKRLQLSHMGYDHFSVLNSQTPVAVSTRMFGASAS